MRNQNRNQGIELLRDVKRRGCGVIGTTDVSRVLEV